MAVCFGLGFDRDFDQFDPADPFAAVVRNDLDRAVHRVAQQLPSDLAEDYDTGGIRPFQTRIVSNSRIRALTGSV